MYKELSDVPVFSGSRDEHKDWSCKLKTFLTTDEKIFGLVLEKKTVDILDRAVNDHGIEDFVQNNPPDDTTELAEWLDTHEYNVLTLKTKDHIILTVSNVADQEDVCGSRLVRFLRSYEGRNANRSEHLDGGVLT